MRKIFWLLGIALVVIIYKIILLTINFSPLILHQQITAVSEQKFADGTRVEGEYKFFFPRFSESAKDSLVIEHEFREKFFAFCGSKSTEIMQVIFMHYDKSMTSDDLLVDIGMVLPKGVELHIKLWSRDSEKYVTMITGGQKFYSPHAF